ncbi:flippase [Larsenimonas suaedae]|uniref:Flippase n=1 Tax=Larsenimonas suaedae TaxID=1851019 RepID=A0ABU1GZ84_9GAMM|nr:flippase [Larsenimonas suaedae]MCM2973466.1 flippase [Larsenimonas suaedae]MDR5897359.1 flippase [Larsenimonas suaedae]
MSSVRINTFWILFEKLFFVLSGLFINVYVARYLGPELFGVLGFSLAMTGLIGPFTTLGANNIVFNRLAKNLPSGLQLLASSARLRLIIFALLALAFTGFAIPYFEDAQKRTVFLIILWGSFFTTNDIFQVFFNARLESKINTLCQNASLLASVLLKLGFIAAKLSVTAFAIANVLQWATSYFMKRHFFKRHHETKAHSTGKISRRHAKYLLKVGLPLAFSGLAIVLYTKTDQIMLGMLIDDTTVGYYTAAITLAQGWIFIPQAIIASHMVRVSEAARDSHLFEKRTERLFRLILWLSLPIAIILSALSPWVVGLIYGEQFSASIDILYISAFSTLFSALGTISYRAITVLGGYRFLFYKMAVVAVLNIAANYLLIPKYGGVGAAMATLLAEILSSVVFNLFFQGGRILKLQCRACLPLLVTENSDAKDRTR